MSYDKIVVEARMSKISTTLLKSVYVGCSVLLSGMTALFNTAHAANSYTGATGLFYVPSAELTPEGNVNIQQNNDIFFQPNDQYLQQFDLEWLYSGKSNSLNGTVNFSIGLLPQVEIGGRLSEFNFTTANGPENEINDLSGNVKWQFLNWRNRCFGAFGLLDFAGTGDFTSKYLSATCTIAYAGEWSQTLAYVDSETGGGLPSGRTSIARPSGLVGGLTYKPFQYFEVLTEYEGSGWNSGFRLNSGTLFGKFTLSAIAKVHSTIDGTDHSIGLDLQFPLGFSKRTSNVAHAKSVTHKGSEYSWPEQDVPAENFDTDPERQPARSLQLETRRDKSLALAINEGAENSQIDGHGFTDGNPTDNTRLAQLSNANFHAKELIHLLENAGFEQIRVDPSHDKKHIVVGFTDNIYRNSYLDGVAVASGITAKYAAARNVETVRILISRHNVNQLILHFAPRPYVDFLNGKMPDAPIKVRYANNYDTPESTATSPKSKLRLQFTPEIVNFVATEKGLHDYSIAARANLSASLGPSLQLKSGYRYVIDDTDDFQKNRVFRSSKLNTGVTDAYLEWATKPLNHLTLLANAGYAEDSSSLKPFGSLQLALTPADGRQQLTVSTSTQSLNDGREHSFLGTYSYYFVNANIRLSLEGGRYSAGQTGYGVSIDRYFDDTIIRFFSRGSDKDNLVAGLAVNFPLGGRRRSSPNRYGIQVGLEERFKYGLETTVRRDDNTNQVEPDFLQRPELPDNLEEDYLDYQRLTPAYLNSQSRRLRNAYHQFVR